MSDLAPGFLIAAPTMDDSRFERAVVLLAESNDEGALGFVLNHRADFTFEQLGEDMELEVDSGRLDDPVHVGGPVSPERGWVLYPDEGDEPDGETTIHIGDELRICATVDVLGRFLRTRARRFKLMLGYAGWGPQQLENEIGEGAWIPMELDTSLVFDVPDDRMWETACSRLGIQPAMFVAKGVAQA